MADELLKLYQDANATAYDRRRQANPKWRFEDESLLRALTELRGEIGSVIDSPVGTGRFLSFYRELGPDVHVLGIDYSDDMLAIARTRADSPRVDFHRQDIIHHPLQSSADLVVCCRFLNLIPWADASATLENLFAAARRFVVLAIRTVDETYVGERVLDGKIHLHRFCDFEAVCQRHGFAVTHSATFSSDRTGDYRMVTLRRRPPLRDGRVNKNFRMVYTFGKDAPEEKTYEVKDRTHAAFIRDMTRAPSISAHFPKVLSVEENFVTVAWVPGELMPAADWLRAVDLLVSIQNVVEVSPSSFDYVEDLVIPRFARAIPLIGKSCFDQVVTAIRTQADGSRPSLCHPDVIPGNIITAGGQTILIDNELLCRSLHRDADVLNMLNNLPAESRAAILQAYLRQSGQSMETWLSRRPYHTSLWFARQVGSAVISRSANRAVALRRAFESGRGAVPYDTSSA